MSLKTLTWLTLVFVGKSKFFALVKSASLDLGSSYSRFLMSPTNTSRPSKKNLF